MDKKIWIVVANSSLARIFRCDSIHSIVEIETFVHPEGRLHGRDLASDRAGSSVGEGHGVGNASLSQTHTPKENSVGIFAKEVAHYLEQARNKGEVKRIHMGASPSFLGILRQSMTHPLAGIVDKTVDKDMTHLKPEEICTYFFVAD